MPKREGLSQDEAEQEATKMIRSLTREDLTTRSLDSLEAEAEAAEKEIQDAIRRDEHDRVFFEQQDKIKESALKEIKTRTGKDYIFIKDR